MQIFGKIDSSFIDKCRYGSEFYCSCTHIQSHFGWGYRKWEKSVAFLLYPSYQCSCFVRDFKYLGQLYTYIYIRKTGYGYERNDFSCTVSQEISGGMAVSFRGINKPIYQRCGCGSSWNYRDYSAGSVYCNKTDFWYGSVTMDWFFFCTSDSWYWDCGLLFWTSL